MRSESGVLGRARRVLALSALVAILAASAPLSANPAASAETAAPRQPVPVLAYYYIWFNASSWNRAKKDYPRVGRYSSDESSVMRQHIREARSAGIDGFLVSWKSTPVLNRRLEQLIKLAEDEHFKLGVIYEGLDFERRPLPAARVAADLDVLAGGYASSPSFQLFDRPLVVIAGSWKFSPEEIAAVAGPRRDRLLVLASDRSAREYQRLGTSVDGNAYYWSSVNPFTNSRYQEKLAALGEAVHAGGGLWLAPAAPGFDARLVGGRSVVERKGGETLRREMDAATASSPDAVGLISWNEFSENTHVEPSRAHGSRYLEVLSDISGTTGPAAVDFDSSSPSGTGGGPARVFVLGGLALVIVGSLVTVARRRAPSTSRSRA